MTHPDRNPLHIPAVPGAPTPRWPSPARPCPRCGSADTALDPIQPRFLLLAILRSTTCRACGFQYSERTGGSLTPVIVAAYAVPLVLAVALVVAALFLVR